MPKTLNIRGILAAIALVVGLAFGLTMNPSTAHAQNVSPQTSSSTPTTGCTTGCPGTSQVGMATIANIAGMVLLSGGTYDGDGSLVNDPTATFEFEGFKEGAVHSSVDVVASGLCNTCQTVSGSGRVQAWERAGGSITFTGRTPGVTYGAANSASAAAVGGISTLFIPYSAPAAAPAPTGSHPQN